MANADQILNLIRCHVEGDDERFRSLALQVSATEAKAGHVVLARSIKEIIKNSKIKVLRPSFNISNTDAGEYLLQMDTPYRLADLVISSNLKNKIQRVLREYVMRDKLHAYNLDNRRKILMYGPSGTGKTMTASVVAAELDLPLYVIRLEKIVTKFMGETSLKLSKVFDVMRSVPAVYFFDEFDAIGQKRDSDNEVGEMRRVLNSFLQLLERDESESLILAATNDKEALDKALFRRFDDILEYSYPTEKEIEMILKEKINGFNFESNVSVLLPLMKGMSQADICMVCKDAIKEVLLENKVLNLSLFKEILSLKDRESFAV